MVRLSGLRKKERKLNKNKKYRYPPILSVEISSLCPALTDQQYFVSSDTANTDNQIGRSVDSN